MRSVIPVREMKSMTAGVRASFSFSEFIFPFLFFPNFLMPENDPEIYEFGEYRLNVGEHELICQSGKTPDSLAEKPFQTLVYLVRNSKRLVTKDELLSAVWPDTFVEENNLSKAVYTIRRHLSKAGGPDKYIETVPKHGYRFIAAVTRVGGGGDPSPVRPVPGKPSSAADERTVNDNRAKAFDLYIRGKVKARIENAEETDAAINLLEKAVSLDPGLAEAYAQLARAYNTKAFKFAAGSERGRLYENAEVAVEKALVLDPELAEAYFARGLVLWSDAKGFPHEYAIKAYTRSLELDPDNDETHHQLSIVYAHVGLMEEAHRSLGRTLELNPNNTMARFRVSNYLAWQGKFAESLAVLKTIPRQVSPMLVDRIRAELLIQLGRDKEALDIVDARLKDEPTDAAGSFTSVKALLFAKAGERERSVDAAHHCVEIGKGFGHFHHTEYNIASSYALLNEPETALRWLKSAAANGFPCYTYFGVDPNLDNLRQFTPFIEFVEKLRRHWSKYKNK